MTPHVAFSNIFKLSFRNIASHVQQGLYRNNVYCKINKFKEHKTISLFNKMAFYSTGQDQEKISRNFMIVGLGNHDMPKTRHSVGMQVVNRLATQLGIQWRKDVKKCGGFVAVCNLCDQQKVILLKPKVAMNVNGSSVHKTAREYNIIPDDVYLVHDELDKAVGKHNIKYGGSARGHNGVRSVMQSLRSEAMRRVLIGIDRPVNRDKVAEYVLTNFTREEQQTVDVVIRDCIQTLSGDVRNKFGVDLLQVNKENVDSVS